MSTLGSGQSGAHRKGSEKHGTLYRTRTAVRQGHTTHARKSSTLADAPLGLATQAAHPLPAAPFSLQCEPPLPLLNCL